MAVVSDKSVSDDLEFKILDNQIRVSTPENISFQYEVTGPFRRLVAYVADILITISTFAFTAFAVLFLLSLLSAFFQNTAIANAITVIEQLASGVILACAFLSLWFYGAYMETNYNGQTLGKMFSRIRTISVNGSSIDASQAALRNFFRLLDVSPFISFGLIFGPEFGYQPIIPIFAFGFICMIVSPNYQRIGDLVAGTMVVNEEKKWAHGLAKFHDKRIPELAELVPDSFTVSPSLAKALAEYVDRRRILPQQRVTEIANHLAKPLISRLGLQKNANSDLVLCALYHKAFLNVKDGEQSFPMQQGSSD